MSPVSIGQTANITYLAADSAEGYNNNGQVNFQITFIGLEDILPSSVIQQSLINPFIYIWTFTVSSLYNTTIITSLGGKYNQSVYSIVHGCVIVVTIIRCTHSLKRSAELINNNYCC